MRRNAGLIVGGTLLIGSVGYLLYKRLSQPTLPPPADLKLPYGYVPGWYSQPPNKGGIYVSLRQGSSDDDVGGGWILRDVTDIRDAAIDPDRDAHVGMLASLVLQNRDAPAKVFTTKILGISGDDFTGQWLTQPPAGGPQMIDFRGAHIFTLRKV
jgi:hypothetical protein